VPADAVLSLGPVIPLISLAPDQWVDDLESERWATTRGFESLRFRPSTSKNTEIMITSRPRVDAGGCISGGMSPATWPTWLSVPPDRCGCRRGVLEALRPLHLVTGGTPHRHGLGVQVGICLVSGGFGQGVAVSSRYRSHSDAMTTTAGQARCSGSDDAVGVPGADCTSRKKRAHQERNPWQPTNSISAREPLMNLTCSCSAPSTEVDQFVRKTPLPDTDDLSPRCDHAVGRAMVGMKLKLDLPLGSPLRRALGCLRHSPAEDPPPDSSESHKAVETCA